MLTLPSVVSFIAHNCTKTAVWMRSYFEYFHKYWNNVHLMAASNSVSHQNTPATQERFQTSWKRPQVGKWPRFQNTQAIAGIKYWSETSSWSKMKWTILLRTISVKRKKNKIQIQLKAGKILKNYIF